MIEYILNFIVTMLILVKTLKGLIIGIKTCKTHFYPKLCPFNDFPEPMIEISTKISFWVLSEKFMTKFLKIIILEAII